MHLLEILMIIVGLVLLSFGANMMVSGVVSLAKRFHISKLLISSVIIGLGTSFPELFVSIKANLANSPEIVMGNIIGSNIANIFFVVGLAALIHPIFSAEKAVKRESMIMMFASLLLIGLIYFGTINRIIALLMLIFLALYLIYSTLKDKKEFQLQSQQSSHSDNQKDAIDIPLETDDSFFQTEKLWLNNCFAFGGLIVLLLGADLLVDNAIIIARVFGLSEAVIGLSLVAIGTSLPELATAIAASIKHQSEVVLGNVIGSSIMNILFILGATGLFLPLPVSSSFLSVDVWVMLLSAVLLSAFVMLNKPIGTFIALIFLAIYVSYSAYLYGFLSL